MSYNVVFRWAASTLGLMAAAGVVASLGQAPAGAATPVLPNPCVLAPPALVATALGVPQTAVHGALQPSVSDGFAIKICVFDHGATHVTVVVAPAAYGQGGGSLPGLVVSHPAGLGPRGAFYHDPKPGLIFASAVLFKGAYWGDAYSNAHVPPAGVLALGRYVYAHLP
jgi:hypothetical protein